MRTTGHNRGARMTRVAILLCFPLLVWTAADGTSFAERLTLPDAVKRAMENNHELRAQKDTRAAAKEDIAIARSHLLPKVSLEERYLRTVNPTYAFMTKLNQERIALADFAPDSLNHPDAVDDFQTSVSLEQPVFAKKATVGLAMSKKAEEAAAADLQRRKEEIAFQVFRTYLMVGTAGGYVTVGEKGLEDAREHRRLADVRYRAGLGLYSDLLRAGTAVTEAEQKLVSAGKNLGVARRALGLAIGSAEPVDVAPETPTLPIRGIDALRAQALARMDLKSMELQTENAANNVKLAEADYFPTVGVGGAYQWNDHNRPVGREGDSWQLMALLRWELFDGTRRRHERAKARYQVSAAEEHLEGLKKWVAFQVEEAWLTLEEAKKNWELVQAALKTAEEGRRLVRVRYEASLSPLVDLLDAQVSFDHARANLVAQENAHKLAIANLCYASGTLIEELGLEEPEGQTQ